MAVTAIKSIRSALDEDTYFVRNLENLNDTGGPGASLSIEPGAPATQCNMWIPWCGSESDFVNRHRIIMVPIAFGVIPVTFTVWQQGDYVRYSKDGVFHDDGELVPGNPAVGGDRGVQIVGHDMNDADLVMY